MIEARLRYTVKNQGGSFFEAVFADPIRGCSIREMSLLDHYWTLASDDPKERVDAAEALIQGLADKNSEEDWLYALKRLVRGLSSTRGSARLGYSMTLAELLQVRARTVRIADYLAMCDEFFQVSAGMKGNEQRGLFLGRLFALEILAKSGLWDLDSTTAEDLRLFAKMSIDLALAKVWLREAPYFALCSLIARLALQNKYSIGIQFAFDYTQAKGLSETCEGVALALSVTPAQRVDLNSKSAWVHGDPLDLKNLDLLAKVLKELPAPSGDVSDTKPYIHFVWSLILREFESSPGNSESLPPPKKKKRRVPEREATRVDLARFWTRCVDAEFFSSSASVERKMWGLEILLAWVRDDQLSDSACLFTPNVVKVWSSLLAKPGRGVHTLARRIADTVVEEVPKRDNEQRVLILAQLMTHCANFDKSARTKVVQPLLVGLDPALVAALARRLIGAFTTATTPATQQWPLDSLLQLVRQYSSDTESSPWIGAAFDALIPRAYYRGSGRESDSQEVGEDITDAAGNSEDGTRQSKDSQSSAMLQDKVTSILAATMRSGSALDASRSWPYTVVKKISSYGSENKVAPRATYSEDEAKAVEKAERTLYKIHVRRTSSRHVDSLLLQAFELLYAVMLLQVYAGQPDAVSILQDLQTCYRKLKGRYAESDESDTDAALVLTEILISLLSQHSAFLRRLTEDVWRMFANDVSEQSLRALCDILAAQEGREGQRSLFDVDNGEPENTVEDDDDDTVPLEGDDSSTNDSNVDDEDGDDANSDDTDAVLDSDYEMDDESRERLANALGVQGEVSMDSSNGESSDEELMNDEQMSALDGHLSIIFSERKKLQTQAREARRTARQARQNVVQLKSRVIDLLSIYFAEQPENLIGLVCLEPILMLIGSTRDKQLEEKGRELVRTGICRKTNYKLTSDADAQTHLSMLRRILSAANATKSKAFQLAAKQVAVFVSKLLISYDRAQAEVVIDLYSQTLKAWFNSADSQISTGFFTDLINFLGTKRPEVSSSHSS